MRWNRWESLRKSLFAGTMEAAGIEPAIGAPPITGISRDFYSHLAGISDGEGCFSIGRINRRKPGGGTFNCSFRIKMRADDLLLLQHLRDETGLGSIDSVTAVTSDGHARNPQVVWRISSKAECLALVRIFDQHPLWSKKARDFEVWREAVIYWNYEVSSSGTDWQPMESLRRELREVKTYESVRTQEVQHG